MDMRGRAEVLDINVLFLFLSLFSNGEFATFGPPVILGESRKGGVLSLHIRCSKGGNGRRSLVKVGTTD